MAGSSSTDAPRQPHAFHEAPVEARGSAVFAAATDERDAVRAGCAATSTRAAAVGLVEVRVVSGPGAGRTIVLGPGRHSFGSASGSAVTIDDPAVPESAGWIVVAPHGVVTVEVDPRLRRRRRELPPRNRLLPGPAQVPNLAAQVTAPLAPDPNHPGRRERPSGAVPERDEIDPDAAQPLLRLARRSLRRRTRWEPGVPLGVGEALLELHAAPTDAGDAEASCGEVTRPPRVLAEPRQGRFVLPDPRARQVPGPRWRSLAREQARAYRRDVEAVRARARAALVAEPGARAEALPDATRVLAAVTRREPRLWERRRGDPDWLLVRAGTGDVPSDVGLVAPDRRRLVRRWTAVDVPVAIDLDRAGVVGLAGPREVRTRLASWLIAQVAAHHAPSDLRICLLTDPDDESGASGWDWARDVPHLHRAATGGPVSLPPQPAADVPAVVAELERLDALLQARRAQAHAVPEALTFDAVLVVVDDAARLRALPQTRTLLKEGPSVGFRFLWLDDDAGLLPRECGVTIDLRPPLLTVRVAGSPVAELVRPDLPDDDWFARLAGGLAGLREAAEGEEVALPTHTRLLSLLGLDPPSGQSVLHGWVVGSGRTTTAVIGEGTRGLFDVDLRRDGPHALIAGVQGAGKSELLQTFIASFAVGNRPDEMAFVLIDHSGSGAFADCARLPHTVGVVTDLDSHQTARALESLTAELDRRRRILARAAVKDVDEYQAGRDAALLAESRAGRLPAGHAFAPRVPRLVLVIDEFAALASDLPDFLSGLVDIATLGRCLGVHLVLATERPAGVVSERIAAAARLRIALRVDDVADSHDIVDAPDAAGISPSLPGRCYARLHGSRLFAFQAARVAGTAPGPHRTGTPRSDLAVLVDAMRDAATDAGIAPVPAPWRPPLPDVVLWSQLPSRPLPGVPTLGPKRPRVVGVDRRVRPGHVPPLRFGLADVPSAQHQDVAVYDLARGGHLLVTGPTGSGCSTMLRALAASVAVDTSPDDVRLRVVDIDRRLGAFAALPHVDTVITDLDAVPALAEDLIAEIARRREVLTRRRLVDAAEQRARAGAGEAWPYLLVVIDRWEDVQAGSGRGAAEESPNRPAPEWRRILADGAKVGIKLILSGSSIGALIEKTPLVGDVLLLRGAWGPDAPEAEGLVDGVVAIPHEPPLGRAVRTGPARGRAGGGSGLPAHEVQVALLTEDPDVAVQDAELRRLGEEAARRYARQR